MKKVKCSLCGVLVYEDICSDRINTPFYGKLCSLGEIKMAAVKVKNKTKYVVTYDSEAVVYVYDTVAVLFLDHPPESDLIEKYANDQGVNIEDVEVYELGRKGKLTKVVTLTFE